MRSMILVGLMMVLLTACTSKFDRFDPTTATVRWVIQNLDVKRTSVHTKPSASPCTATKEAVSNRGGVEPLPPCEYVHGKHGG
jgi:hypothetical protein